VLDGPNLYFTRPAVKLTLSVPGWLQAGEEAVGRIAVRAGVPGADTDPPRLRPGAAGTEHRRRFVARTASHVVRTLAQASGTNLAVRWRSGAESNEIVVAYPWRRRTVAEAMGREAAGIVAAMLSSHRGLTRLVSEAAHRLASVEPGPAPTVPDPTIPVIAVTGTNGKTTTVRALSALGRAAGLSVAYSSTDGVYLNDQLVEEGDYSGFGGAARALAQPGVQLAVLETARGGILLRGIGTRYNDVAVVTNISADHLGLHGIQTLDQLAEVKAAVTHITRPEGWDVLNADDPRVLAMRRGAKGRPWLFSMDPDHPAIRSVVAEHGRATTVLDGWASFLTEGMRVHQLLPLEDIPLTLAGISSQHTQNALAVASAAMGVGLPVEAVVEGLRIFVLDPETNPGRANLFELDGKVVIADYAHNEAGLAGLIEIARGFRPPRGRIWLAFDTAGDRTDQILHGMGYLAARGSDRLAIAELIHYLRGRDRQDHIDRLLAGAADGGATDVPVFIDELHALDWMLKGSRPGDVVGVTALIQRTEIFDLMKERGAERIGPDRVRDLVRRARGH
jgi:cyanophycin synthetase